MLYLLLALGGLVAVVEVLIANGPLRLIYVAYLFPAVGALYVLTGLFAWWRRPANRLGQLMTACGAVITASSYANTDVPALIAVGMLTATLPLSVVIHLVHACPTGVVEGRAARITVAAGYLAGLVLEVPTWAFTPEPAPFDVVLVSPRPHLAELGSDVQRWFGAVVVLATLVLLTRRLRGYNAADRRLLAALLGFAVLAVLTVAVGGDVLPSLGLDAKAVADVQLAAVAIVPLGFLLIVLRGGFARPIELTAFAATVAATSGTAEPGRELDRAVAAALGDPSAVLVRWAEDTYVDADGRPVTLPAPGPHRAIVAIDGAVSPLGAIVLDTALGADPAAVAAVTQVAGIALERERLAREVSTSRAALQEASRRVLAAGDEERRRVARDLHDGLQGALVLLALHARNLAGEVSSDQVRRAVDDLATGVDAAARTLRELVSGVLPSPLVEGGLVAALRELADDLPMDVSVSVDPPDLALPASVETTAYFIVAEAVTNVVKHAQASRTDIAAGMQEGTLTLEIVDDGVGDLGYTGGTGLVGLRDRLAILGGTVEVTSPGVGTRVVARVPCG